MEAKQFLKQYQVTRTRIRNMESTVQELEDLLEKVTAGTEGERVQTSGPKDKVGDLVARIVDYRDEIMSEWARALDQLAKIEAVIQQVDDSRLQQILHMRYAERKKWEEIASELEITERGVHAAHGRALKIVQEILDSSLYFMFPL